MSLDRRRTKKSNSLSRIFVPGRATLLGEHQDYLDLPVMPTPIRAGLNFQIALGAENKLSVYSSAIKDPLEMSECKPSSDREDPWALARATICLFQERIDEGILKKGVEISISGSLPPLSGLSSSAALSVGLLRALFLVLGEKPSPAVVAELAYEAEHDLLGVPCGKMDQYSVAYEDTLIIHFHPSFRIKPMHMKFPLVVIDSGIPKSTAAIHIPLQNKLREALSHWLGSDDFLLLHSIKDEEVEEAKFHEFGRHQELWKIIKGFVGLRDTTAEGIKSIHNDPEDLATIGDLMTKQHVFLSQYLEVSHPELDRIVWHALEHGAFGAKLTGAGKGGSVIVLTSPSKKEELRTVLKDQFRVLD